VAEITDGLYATGSPVLQRAAGRNVLAHLVHLARRGLVEPLGPWSEEAAFRRA
jgi:hypothetical protein